MSIANLDNSMRLPWGLRTIRLLEVPAIGFLIVTTAIRSLSGEDINFWDETNYLNMGLSVGSGEFAQFSSGATYGHFYFFISQFVEDPIDLYFAGRAAAASLLVLGVWFSARILSGPLLAWTAGAAIAVTSSPYAWPGVATPAAAALIVGCAIMLRWRNLVSVGLASAFFWLAAGARPEFSWLALIATLTAVGWAAVDLVRNQKGQRRFRRFGAGLSVAIGTLAVPLLLILLHGSPFRETGRQWVAFG